MNTRDGMKRRLLDKRFRGLLWYQLEKFDDEILSGKAWLHWKKGKKVIKQRLKQYEEDMKRRKEDDK